MSASRITGSNDQGESKIRSLDVAVKILLEMTRSNEPCRVSKLALDLGMHKSKVSRHLATLRSQGLVDKVPESHAFVLGRSLIVLGQAAMRQNKPLLIARPYLEQLRDKTRLATLFCVRAGYGVTALMSLDAIGSIISVPTGGLLMPPDSPSACVALAFGKPGEIDDFIERHEHIPGLSSKNKIAKFRKKIRNTMENKYDWILDSHRLGFGAIAAPVFNGDDELEGTVTVVAGSTLIGEPPNQSYVEGVRECAAVISNHLGSNRWRE